MSKALFVSINPNAVAKIIKKIKNHEFRNYIPKKEFDTLYVYTTSPKSEIKYVLKISKVIKYPELIDNIGDGNEYYNNGIKSKYAYEINEIYELSNSINLNQLKNKYKFTPPQSFAYDECYLKLSDTIENSNKTRI